MTDISKQSTARAASKEEEPLWKMLLGGEPAYHPKYHDNAHDYIVDMFTRPPTCLLEIGGGSGATALAVKARYPACRAIGIEPNAKAAQVAATRLDRVYCTTVENFDPNDPEFPLGKIDAALLLDVLEHLYNPWNALVSLKSWLAPNAQVIASVPNVRNLRLIGRLLEGYWTYEDQGLLDITHIRFFTLREIRRMFAETGYRVLQTTRIADARLPLTLPEEGERADLSAGRIVLKDMTAEEIAELAAQQFVVVAEPG